MLQAGEAFDVVLIGARAHLSPDCCISSLHLQTSLFTFHGLPFGAFKA